MIDDLSANSFDQTAGSTEVVGTFMAPACRSTKNSEIMLTHHIPVQAHVVTTPYSLACSHGSLIVHNMPHGATNGEAGSCCTLILRDKVIVTCMNCELLAMKKVDCPL